jgi:hypothetical protein
MVIDLLVNKGILKDIVSEQFRTDLSWAKSVVRKHKKSTCIEQMVTHPVPVISNCYNLLCNDTNGKNLQQCRKVKGLKFQTCKQRSDEELYKESIRK